MPELHESGQGYRIFFIEFSRPKRTHSKEVQSLVAHASLCRSFCELSRYVIVCELITAYISGPPGLKTSTMVLHHLDSILI